MLGPRLRRCAQLVAGSGAVTAQALMGSVDALKLRSSMTLFADVTDDNREFVGVLEKYYDGEPDPLTVEFLGLAARWRRWPSRAGSTSSLSTTSSAGAAGAGDEPTAADSPLRQRDPQWRVVDIERHDQRVVAGLVR